MLSALLRLSVPERESPNANTWKGSFLAELAEGDVSDFDSMIKGSVLEMVLRQS